MALGWTPRAHRDSILDTAKSLVVQGLVKAVCAPSGQMMPSHRVNHGNILSIPTVGSYRMRMTSAGYDNCRDQFDESVGFLLCDCSTTLIRIIKIRAGGEINRFRENRKGQEWQIGGAGEADMRRIRRQRLGIAGLGAGDH